MRIRSRCNTASQLLCLTPQMDLHQHAVKWHIDAPGEFDQYVDAYGNVTHTLTLTRPHIDLALYVSGQVEVMPTQDGRILGEDSRLPIGADAIFSRVDYMPGTTDVTTPATDILRQGRGVCQDYSHLFLSCAHLLGRPARYVSGYLYTTAEHAASHAW